MTLSVTCRRDSRDRLWRNGDMEAYGEQGYYSREEDNDSITSRERYTSALMSSSEATHRHSGEGFIFLCVCRHYPDEPPLYRDHYDGHASYTNSSYGNGYSEGRRTTRRRLLPATPTGETMSQNPLCSVPASSHLM